jgi:hypothetical protein
MRSRYRALLLLPLLLLGGCWQSKGSLYRGVMPVTPFAAGAVTETGKDEWGKPLIQHFLLAKSANGAYRMTSTSSDKEDAGRGFLIRFFPLSGLPANTYVYEAAPLEHCDTRRGCAPLKAMEDRWYGLARASADGAEEMRPDCTRDMLALAPSRIQDAEGACNFTDRATLEQALLAFARTNPAATVSYRLPR